MKNYKKITIGIIIVALIAIIIYGIYKLMPSKSYTEISYSEYQEMINNKEDFILYIGSSQCSHCIEFKPTIEKVINDYDLDIKYINIYELSTKEYEVLKNKTKIQGTPTIVFIEDGIAKSGDNKIEGSKDYNSVVSKLKENGYIE